MSAAESASSVVERLSGEAHGRELARYVSRLALAAADARDARFGAGPGEPAPLSLEAPLPPEAAETPFGNALTILRQGAQSSGDRTLLGALVALGVEADVPSAPESELLLAARLVWLATHTPVDPLPAADAALGDKAAALWSAIGRIAADPVRVGHGMTRAEALVAVAALSSSSSEAARAALEDVAQHSSDPLIRGLLDNKDGGSASLSGELSPAPHGPLVTALLTVTLLLFALHAGRLIGRFAFSYRKPARLRLSPRGLELEQRTEMLGKVLRDRSVVVPLTNLARVTREVRYPRAGMYAGLAALVVGSYLGMGLLIDGVRVPGGSAPLIGLAVLLMVVGLVIDFALSALADPARGRCRLVVVPRKGRTLCISALDAKRADAMLQRLAHAGEPVAQR
ncbi:MAG TPA: hypothetical protein VK524_14035 [Polyangiaceae bacterium]|nr:hypothetical protein [Polyangiaceae bacterium]